MRVFKILSPAHSFAPRPTVDIIIIKTRDKKKKNPLVHASLHSCRVILYFPVL